MLLLKFPLISMKIIDFFFFETKLKNKNNNKQYILARYTSRLVRPVLGHRLFYVRGL